MYMRKEKYKNLPRGDNMKEMNTLPFNVNLDTIQILKELNKANNSIGELKGIMNLLPNPNIILS